jgi:hypothetical protein
MNYCNNKLIAIERKNCSYERYFIPNMEEILMKLSEFK